MPGTTNFPTGLDTPINILSTTEEDDTGFLHDEVHNNHDAAIVAVQTKVGIDGSADTDSHDYKIAQLEAVTLPVYPANETLAACDCIAVQWALLFPGPSELRVAKADADSFFGANSAPHGFAANAAAGAGDPVTLVTSGPFDGFTGLTAGEIYYLSTTPGAITTTPGEWIVGLALTATMLYVDIHKASTGGSVDEAADYDWTAEHTFAEPIKAEVYEEFPASENLDADQPFVNIWDDSGTLKVRPADASNGRHPNAFIKANVTSGNPTRVFRRGLLTLSGLVAGSNYVLSATVPGEATLTCPSTSGHHIWSLGQAKSTTVLDVDIVHRGEIQ